MDFAVLTDQELDVPDEYARPGINTCCAKISEEAGAEHVRAHSLALLGKDLVSTA